MANLLKSKNATDIEVVRGIGGELGKKLANLKIGQTTEITMSGVGSSFTQNRRFSKLFVELRAKPVGVNVVTKINPKEIWWTSHSGKGYDWDEILTLNRGKRKLTILDIVERNPKVDIYESRHMYRPDFLDRLPTIM